jgi:hypothetical protein
VRTKCAGKTCVGLWGYSWGPRELPGVSRPSLREASRYNLATAENHREEVESFFKDKLACNKIAMTYYLFSNAVSSYFWSNIATWWEGVMLIVHAHEEPHPVAVPK